MEAKGLKLFKDCTDTVEIKRFETIDAEPLFACKIRGSFMKRLSKSTPWLRINCNRDHKKKMKMRLALFLLPIVIIGVLTGGACVSVNEYKKGYKEFFNESNDVAFNEPKVSCEDCKIILINNKNANKNNFTPSLEFYEGLRCEKSIIKDLQNLMSAAKENGCSLKVKTGYISGDDLNSAYDEVVKNLMENEGYTQVRADDRAQKMVSNAKFSEYTTGLLVDIVPAQNSVDSNDYRWLIRNCADYGFILRYPKNKENKTGRDYNPYCFRHVGIENAKKMRSLAKCLEEYCMYLKLDYKY